MKNLVSPIITLSLWIKVSYIQQDIEDAAAAAKVWIQEKLALEEAIHKRYDLINQLPRESKFGVLRNNFFMKKEEFIQKLLELGIINEKQANAFRGIPEKIISAALPSSSDGSQ
jgi:hypothetical protein